MGQLCDLFYPGMALRQCMADFTALHDSPDERTRFACLSDHAMEDNGLPIYNYPSSIVHLSNILMLFFVTLPAYV